MAQYFLEDPLGYVQMTSITAAVGLTGIPAGAKGALFVVEVARVRWRDDGTAPTATVGMALDPVSSTVVGEPFYYQGDLRDVQVIGASGAILNISYYGG